MTNQQVETLKVLATDEDSGVRSGAVSRTPRRAVCRLYFRSETRYIYSMTNETTPMTLSSEAQSVLDAIKTDLDDAPWVEDSTMIAALSTAVAALRAAAAIPSASAPVPFTYKLLAIADELEAQ